LKPLKIPRNILLLLLTGTLFILLMTLLRVAFLYAFTPPSGALPVPYAKSFILGLRYDARMVAIPCLLLFLLGLIPILNPFHSRIGKRVALTIWSLLVLIAGIFYSIDFANYAYLTERLNGGLLNYVSDTKTSVHMVWETYPVIRILLALLVSVTLLTWMIRLCYRKIAGMEGKVAGKAGRILYNIAFFLFLAFLIFGRVGQYPLRWSDAFTLGNDYASNVALNPFQSFFSSLKFRKSTYEIDKVKKAYPLMVAYLGITNPDSSKLNYTRVVKPDTVLQRQPNVVIVICESFSSYKSSMHGNPLNTTPFFAQMCKEGIFFNRCFTPSYGTARGVWTTITGIPDVDLTKTSSRNPNAVNQHTIVNDFKGYEKFYFIGGSLSWANIRGVLTNNIQDLHLYEQDDYGVEKIDVWGISDKNLFLSANKVLAQQQQKPFIAVIQTADNHRPYTIPDEDKKEFKLLQVAADSLKRFGFESLDEYNAFRYTDYCYQKFIEAARKESYFSNTVFVFVGDHGIGGDVRDMFPRAWTQELSSQHVPLLFYAPGFLAPREFGFSVSQVDVLPTAAGLCKINYTNTTLGRDLLSPFILDNPAVQAAFIFNPDKRRIGVVKDSLFFSYGAEGRLAEQAYSINGNAGVSMPDSLRRSYYDLTEAYYQTARYMLLNNKVK
jgi:phosphoglycerol transferase MdoB-like AlkP superfamily enzyme